MYTTSLCCNVPRVLDHRTATAVCCMCGDSICWNDEKQQSTDHELKFLSYKKSQKYRYSRQNHLRVWLLRLQGKDHIPSKVINEVKNYVECFPYKDKYPDTKLVIAAFRMTKNAKYINSLETFYKLAYKKPPFKISSSDIISIETIFNIIESSFEKRVRVFGQRYNMLSYAFILDMILKMLKIDYPKIKKLVNMPKVRDVEEIWCVLCEDLKINNLL